MKTIIISTAFIFLNSTLLFCQDINRIDSSGLKQGTWTVYLDANWKKIDDSSSACFIRYAFYINDGNLYPMAQWGKKGFTLKKNGETVFNRPGESEILNGEYKWYNKKGQLISTHVLENGVYQSYEYYHKNGNLKGGFLYTEQCGDTPYDYCIFLCDKNGNVTYKSAIPRDETGKPINKE